MDKPYHDIYCPSCGRSDAVATLETLQYLHDPKRWVLRHELCGHQQEVTDRIGKILTEHLGSDLRWWSWNSNPQSPEVCLSLDLGDRAVQALNQTRQEFGHFVLRTKIVLKVTPSSITCPVCQSNKFRAHGMTVVCKDHYAVDALSFMKGYLHANGYQTHSSAYDLVISQPVPATGILALVRAPTDTFIARLSYRHALMDRNIVVLSTYSHAVSPETYHALVKLVQDCTAFEVIVKQE